MSLEWGEIKLHTKTEIAVISKKLSRISFPDLLFCCPSAMTGTHTFHAKLQTKSIKLNKFNSAYQLKSDGAVSTKKRISK